MSGHPLSPLPEKLARLLVREDPSVASKADNWLRRESHGKYSFIHEWMQGEDDLDQRRKLGTRLIQLLEDGNTAELD